MKTILISLFLFISLSKAQTYDELYDMFYYTSTNLTASQDSNLILTKIAKTQDSIINNQQKIIRNDSITNLNNEKIIETFKNQITAKPMSFIKYRGVYFGGSIFYQFDSIKATVISGMKFDLTATIKFDIMNQLDISGQVGVPLRNEKFFLKIIGEWRGF